MTDVVEVIVTGPHDIMHDLVTALVRERLIAGAHLMPINSTYRWQGAVRNAQETRAAMHTTAVRVDSLIERITREHPYQVPCVMVVPFTCGEPKYIKWVQDETQIDSSPG